MSEVDQAAALLVAAGLKGVKVQEAAEQVSVSRAELKTLRAAAATTAAEAESPGQRYVREQQETAGEAAALPPGILDAATTEREMDRIEAAALSQLAKRAEFDRLNLTESWEHHARGGR